MCKSCQNVKKRCNHICSLPALKQLNIIGFIFFGVCTSIYGPVPVGLESFLSEIDVQQSFKGGKCAKTAYMEFFRAQFGLFLHNLHIGQ